MTRCLVVFCAWLTVAGCTVNRDGPQPTILATQLIREYPDHYPGYDEAQHVVSVPTYKLASE